MRNVSSDVAIEFDPRAYGAVTSSCRPLKRTRFDPLTVSRHFRAGLSHAAASRLIAVPVKIRPCTTGSRNRSFILA